MKQLLLFFLLIIPSLSFSQSSDCACCTPDHSQFDFWVGDWEVFDKDGKKIGENLIVKLEDNCIVNENWTSENGGSGKSYNYYDPSTETWNQLWISNTGNILKLKGIASENKMTLKSEITQGTKGKYYNQITWTENKDGSVNQLWEIYDQKGNLLNNVFEGIYKKKNSD
ncbi:hypothetical protein ML462_14680 [Gramella lutea]|uniref:Uncharacterized protein n=1 Tax=Christiangramia lutea TaxID=1607951 RepID=A0A9X1V5D5_9FLAO|nr:hypothetical protein [Christiangramia lutea]MCH4824416.1 hypothetical protein [Christiangramia lutea]